MAQREGENPASSSLPCASGSKSEGDLWSSVGCQGSLADEPRERRKLWAGGEGTGGIVHPPRPTRLWPEPCGGEDSAREWVDSRREKPDLSVEV